MIGLLRSRVGLATAAAIVLVGATLGAAVALAHVSNGKGSLPASSVPGVLQTPQSGSCTSNAQARQVWSDVSGRLDALVLHPSLSGVDAVAQGAAATQMRQYIQQRLLDHNLSEREKSRLDDLSIVQPGCGLQPLTVRVTETLMQDDYLASDGHVDHVDAGVGQTSHLLETYVRSGGTWKVLDIASLDQSPSPGTTV
jgi:hypothetical protein